MNQAEFRAMIASRPMTIFQYVVVALCIIMNISDGYDAASMSNAAPLIRNDWNVSPDMLGIAFSAQAIGMVVGSILLAPLADRFGRRTIIFSAMGFIAAAMTASVIAGNVETLTILRFCTGIGLGTMIVSLNVMMVEYTNQRLGNIFVALLHSGFAVGTTISGLITVPLVEAFGWQGIFATGGISSAVLCLLVLLLLPESLEFLIARRPKNALARANSTLRKLRQPELAALPEPPPTINAKKTGQNVSAVLIPALRRPSLLLLLMAFAYYIISYFQFQWTPAVLADAGLPEHAALSSHTVTGLGSLIGNISMGIFASTFGSARLTGAYMAGAAASLLTLGLMPAEPGSMLLVAGLTSFFMQGAFTGMMITIVRFYPPELRSTGTGFVIGFGRIGAVLGPYLGGVLMAIGWERQAFYAVFAACALIGAFAIWSLVKDTAKNNADAGASPQTH